MACASVAVVGVAAFQPLSHAAASSSSSTFGKSTFRIRSLGACSRPLEVT
jgi:hypothetical protein